MNEWRKEIHMLNTESDAWLTVNVVSSGWEDEGRFFYFGIKSGQEKLIRVDCLMDWSTKVSTTQLVLKRSVLILDREVRLVSWPWGLGWEIQGRYFRYRISLNEWPQESVRFQSFSPEHTSPLSCRLSEGLEGLSQAQPFMLTKRQRQRWGFSRGAL